MLVIDTFVDDILKSRVVGAPPFEQMRDMFSVLANIDTIVLFTEVGNGMKGGAETLQKLHMTKKRFYTRLRELVDSGLVEKAGKEYKYTLLGALFEQQFVSLFQISTNLKELLMMEELRKSERFTSAEIGNFVRRILDKNPSSAGEGSWLIPRVIWTYAEMVDSVVGRVSAAKKTIYLASRFTEERIINAMIGRAQAGVEVKVLADTRLLKNYIQSAGEKLKAQDSHTPERRKVAVNPFYPFNVERRFSELPFSFILLDGKGVGVELVDARCPSEFSGVVFLENESVFNYLKSAFDSLWMKGNGGPPQVISSSSNSANPS